MKNWTCRYFDGREFLPPDVYGKIDFMMIIDPRITWTVDALRVKFAEPITINNWHLGGEYTQRGYRTIDIGAPYSQHRFGRAVDFTIRGISSDRFRNMVRKGELNQQLQYITRIEDNVKWIHIDCAPIKSKDIVFFK